METTKDTDLVVRHNKLINANIKLTAKEYDLVRTFMRYIKRSDSDFWTFTVMASEVGIETKRGKDTVRSIGRKPVEIDIGKDGLVSIPFFTSLKYSNGSFEGKFNNDLKDMLLEMQSNFTQTYEQYILPMDSIYAKRIYELLAENKNIGYRKFRLDDLYETLQIPKSMRTYANFKKKVLIVAIREINKHTDIYIPVDIENQKDPSWLKLQCGKSRGITHLNFEFRKKDDKGLFAIQNTEMSIEDEIRSAIDIDYYPDDLKPFYIERLLEFIDYCVKNNKRYPDWEVSFDRHIKGYIKALKNNDKRI
jgi:hypothetical protein